ncbi:L-histidine N(alpha)-methyltransferase [Parablastomonas sp. CN1-191]|uniref:L-histidine N(alpha)-methyltransferase n=1 Tax=Parablastomonas sp. CN1-191 TaxID=3400908 RepID=UPI003BF84589
MNADAGIAQGLALVSRDEDGVDIAFRAQVLAGLGQRQKAIPARWFYDEAGSQLFEAITELPEYYPTRTEVHILEAHCADMGSAIGPGRAVVEFGSGSSMKTPLVLRCIDPAAYVPIDISGDFLRASAAALAADFPGLAVVPVEADFTRPVLLPPGVSDLPKLGFFPGSTIGNMVPPSAVDLLRSMRGTLGHDAMLLIGMDRIKDPAVLVAAYDDAAGTTGAFNLNLASRINRELGGTIPVDALHHEARWNDTLARIEMHLVAARDIAFTVAGKDFTMATGESIHTENSHKFDARSAATLLLAGGWSPRETWTDVDGLFSVILADASEARMAP